MNEDFDEPAWYEGDHCSEECIREQLKAFYKDFKCEPTVKDKVGHSDTAASTTSNEGMEG